MVVSDVKHQETIVCITLLYRKHIHRVSIILHIPPVTIWVINANDNSCLKLALYVVWCVVHEMSILETGFNCNSF